jgi:microcystin-dependent protein
VITPKPLGNALRLEIESDPAPGALTNMVQNPNGTYGGWFWLTPVVGSAMSSDLVLAGAPWLVYTSPGGVASFFTSEPMPVAAGLYVAASLNLLVAQSYGYYRLRFEWLDTNRVLLSPSTQSGYLNVSASYGPIQAPASTAYVRLRVDHYANTAGGNPAANTVLTFNQVTVAKAATSAALGQSWTNVVPDPSFEAGIAGWTSTQATTLLARDTTQHQDGAASLRVTANATTIRRNLVKNPTFATTLNGWQSLANTWQITRDTNAGRSFLRIAFVPNMGDAYGMEAEQLASGRNSVVVGQTYSVSADTNYGSLFGAKNAFRLTARFYNAAGVAIGGSMAATLWSIPANTWRRATTNAAVAPTGAVTLGIHAAWDNGSGGSVMLSQSASAFLSQILVEQTSAPGAYFDGSTANTSTVTHAWDAAVGASPSSETTRVGTTDQGASSPPLPVAGGQYYTASAHLKRTTGSGTVPVDQVWTWKDTAGSVVGATAVSLMTLSDTWQRGSNTQTSPVNATSLVLTFRAPKLAALDGFHVDAVLVELGQTLNAYYEGTRYNANLSYLAPVSYTNILGSSHDITVSREALNVGTMTANIVDSALDPSQSTAIRPGRAVRLMAYSQASTTWRHLFSGTASHAAVEYELTDPNAQKRAHIELTAVDNIQTLAQQKRPNGVATITDLPAVLEGCGVPWNVNGSGNQVPSALTVAINDNASAVDQVAVTRDSVLGYSWVDRMGTLQAWDRAKITTALAGPTLSESVYKDIAISYSAPDDCINEVVITFLRLNPDDPDNPSDEVVYPNKDMPLNNRNEASIASWGVQSANFTIQGIAENQASLQAFIDAVLSANSTPVVRLNSAELAVDLVPDWSAVDTASWFAFADLYDLVEVTCARASITKQKARVTGIKHTLSSPESRWATELSFTADKVVASPSFVPSPTAGTDIQTIGELLRPIGEVTQWYGAKGAIPAGWLAMDGTTFSATTYPKLYALLGSTILPDLTDRFAVGAGTKGLGTVGGSPTKTIAAANLPPHAHTIAHTHDMTHGHSTQSGSAVGGSSLWFTRSSGTTPLTGGGMVQNTTGDTGPSLVGNSGNGPGTSTPMDVLNPWMAIWFIIRAR